jgi:ribonuclease G
LVVIDVNTGKFVGKKDLEDTILKTNLEAVKEIAHQLRIRNCGGIVIIDFIDMEKELNREKVLEALQEELKKDRAKTSITGMSSLGLVEMTRKRVRPSLLKALCEPCNYCDGKGYIKNKNTISGEIFRQIERDIYMLKSNSDSILVHCHPSIADWIYDEESISLEQLEKKISKRIIFKVQSEYHIEQFEIEM